MASALKDLAGSLIRKGKLEEGETCLNEALRINERVFGREAKEMVSVLNTLAAYHSKSGRYKEAEALIRRCLTLVGESLDDPDALVFMNNLGQVLMKRGRLDKAEAQFLRALDGHLRVFGAEHDATLSVQNAFAGLMQRQKRFEESEALYREVLATRRRLHGDKHPSVHNSLHNLGNLLLAQERVDECIIVTREAVGIARDILEPESPYTALSLGLLGFALRETKDPANYPESEQSMLLALRIQESSLPKDHPSTLNTLRGLRRLYRKGAMNDPTKLADVEARIKAARSWKPPP